MIVIQINTVVNTGSTGRIAEEIGSLLIDKGHDSYIAHGRVQDKSKSKLIKIGTKIDAYAHGAYTLLTDKHAFASTNATRALVSKIKEIKPDLIALHNLHGYYINIEVLFHFLKEVQIPVVWTLFDCWAFTGHCTYYDDINCTKWKTQCYDCPKTSKYPKSFIDNSKLNYRRKKQLFTSIEKMEIITHSKWLSDQVKSSFLSAYQTHVTPSAINLDLFKPIESNLKKEYNIKGNVILGCASVWTERKGLEDFIKLSAMFDENYTIVLIGLSKKQIRSLPDNIIGINRTESIEDLAKWYTLASVFVNPTSQDNFPTTNIEALACGTPIITYDTGGSPEAIDEFTGRVVKKYDVLSLKKCIYELCEKEDESLSNNCRKRAENLYDKKFRYMDYLSVFENLIGNCKSKYNLK